MQYHQRGLNPQADESPKSVITVGPLHQTTVNFEYVGKTGLMVVGPISGKRYRFNYTGAIVAVDARDAPSLIAVPNLRSIKYISHVR